MVVEIISTNMNAESIRAIATEMQRIAPSGCNIESKAEDRIVIRAPYKTDLRVGNAVALGTRILIMDAVAQLKRPFSFDCRYILPNVRSTEPFITDAGEVSGFEGLKFGGVG